MFRYISSIPLLEYPDIILKLYRAVLPNTWHSHPIFYIQKHKFNRGYFVPLSKTFLNQSIVIIIQQTCGVEGIHAEGCVALINGSHTHLIIFLIWMFYY